ncbi:MAG: DUF2203 domain-containing protein [Candidatus Eisenbacteria bacterium]|uniref:DUF2203 domain-containing protein n=1 Tax=Eiseniibacteriota bacterium TaxID=2212470 RepID=A0A849SE73_UNCEI|nr:DUF2203 domain-containing protein [Candidatus Eisenbacteria bacterium]
MKITLFSIEEATRQLVEVRPRMEQLVKMNAEFDRIQSRVGVLKVVTAGVSDDNPDLRERKALEERTQALAEEISRGIAAIQRLGAVVKDLDRGLVDFYALSGDRLVFLCWRLGESEVSHWHSLDGGFSSRQPLHSSERD